MCKTFYTFLHGLLSIIAERTLALIVFTVILNGEVKLKIDVNSFLQTLSCKLEFAKHANCILQGAISFLHVPVNFQLFQCTV